MGIILTVWNFKCAWCVEYCIESEKQGRAWLAQLLRVQLWLRSWSHVWWVWAPHQALGWQLEAWSLLRILCLPLSLSLPISRSVSLSLSLKKEWKLKKKIFFNKKRWKTEWLYDYKCINCLPLWSRADWELLSIRREYPTGSRKSGERTTFKIRCCF